MTTPELECHECGEIAVWDCVKCFKPTCVNCMDYGAGMEDYCLSCAEREREDEQ